MTALLANDAPLATLVCAKRRLFVAPSRHGLGFFTGLAIPIGDVFFEASGHIGSERTRHTAQLDGERHLDAPHLRFINHSCEPNVRLDVPPGATSVRLEALRDMAAGEEVLLDYASFEDRIRFGGTCGCGAERCRRRMSGYLDLTEEERARVSTYATPWLRELTDQG